MGPTLGVQAGNQIGVALGGGAARGMAHLGVLKTLEDNGIMESINLPVLATPINRSGQALVDGGLINNVPADVLVSRGCNFVIAVSVTTKMEHEFAKNRPDMPTSKMKSASTLQTVLRSYLVQSVNMNSIGVQPADIVIEPDVSEFELTEFTKTDQLSAVGEETTMASLSKIKKC